MLIDIDHITKFLDIDYKVNKQGYRTYEFDDINWSECYVILGCSQTFGEGLPNNEDLVSKKLESLLDEKVINLGVPGGGIDIQYYNLLSLLQKGIYPKGVFIIVPDPHRYCRFIDNKVKMFGPWSDDYEKTFVDTAVYTSSFHMFSIFELCKLIHIPIAGVDIRQTKEFAALALPSFRPIDSTTDNSGHYGPNTHKHLAELLYRQIK